MINLTDAQVERIKFLFYTPTAELPTEKLVEQLNTELAISLPEGAYALLFQAILEKKIIERPRKVRPVEKEEVVKAEKVTEFTFAVAGKTVVVHSLGTIAKANNDKLADRAARGVLHGDGDNR